MIAALRLKDGTVTQITPFPDTESAKAHMRWLRDNRLDDFDSVRFRELKTKADLDTLRELYLTK